MSPSPPLLPPYCSTRPHAKWNMSITGLPSAPPPHPGNMPNAMALQCSLRIRPSAHLRMQVGRLGTWRWGKHSTHGQAMGAWVSWGTRCLRVQAGCVRIKGTCAGIRKRQVVPCAVCSGGRAQPYVHCVRAVADTAAATCLLGTAHLCIMLIKMLLRTKSAAVGPPWPARAADGTSA